MSIEKFTDEKLDQIEAAINAAIADITGNHFKPTGLCDCPKCNTVARLNKAVENLTELAGRLGELEAATGLADRSDVTGHINGLVVAAGTPENDARLVVNVNMRALHDLPCNPLGEVAVVYRRKA